MKILFIIDVQPIFLNTINLKKIPNKIYFHILKNNYDYIFSFGFLNYKNSPFTRFWKWNKCMINSDESTLFYNLKIKSNYILYKNTFSCYNDELLSILTKINFNKFKDKIFICGLDTDVCILSTCMDLFINNYNIYVLKKLCGSDKGYRYHKSGLKVLKHILGRDKLII